MDEDSINTTNERPAPKPPLVALPRHIHEERRMRELMTCIQSNWDDCYDSKTRKDSMVEWLEELAELAMRERKRLLFKRK